MNTVRLTGQRRRVVVVVYLSKIIRRDRATSVVLPSFLYAAVFATSCLKSLSSIAIFTMISSAVAVQMKGSLSSFHFAM